MTQAGTYRCKYGTGTVYRTASVRTVLYPYEYSSMMIVILGCSRYILVPVRVLYQRPMMSIPVQGIIRDITFEYYTAIIWYNMETNMPTSRIIGDNTVPCPAWALAGRGEAGTAGAGCCWWGQSIVWQ